MSNISVGSFVTKKAQGNEFAPLAGIVTSISGCGGYLRFNGHNYGWIIGDYVIGGRRFGIGWVEGDGSFSMNGELTSDYEQAAKDAEVLSRGNSDTAVVIFEVKEYFRSETTVKRTAA